MIRAETAIRELNKRGYVVEISQADNFKFDIRLIIIGSCNMTIVYEVCQQDLAAGLLDCLEWLDKPASTELGCYFRVKRDGKWMSVDLLEMTEGEIEVMLIGQSESFTAKLIFKLSEMLNKITKEE